MIFGGQVLTAPPATGGSRSVNATNSNNFRLVNTDGSNSNNNANYSNGFAPGFKEKWGQNK